MLFQEKLKELRKEKDISQYVLADDLHISRSVVAKWETGLAIPNEDNLLRLCEYFNVQKDELISDIENEKIVTSKNKKISTFQKIIYLLSSLLILSIIAIVIIYSIGFKKTETKDPFRNDDIVFSLIVNEKDTYYFEYTVIKPSNEYEIETFGYVIYNIPLNRGDIIEIYEGQKLLSSTFILWSSPIIPEPNGGFFVQKEGYYDLMITEEYFEDNRTSITLNSKRIASLYESITLYYVSNGKAPITMTQVLDENSQYGPLFLHSWYVENITLNQGDKIYFFATLKTTKKLVQVKDFIDNRIFEELYDENLMMHYILVKETHQFNYLMLGQNEYFMTLSYEYSSGN